jgi:chromosome segregation ATPase
MTALKKMCEEAQKNFDLRKAARMEEIKAVSDTITILMDDDARDKAASTFGESFLQVSSEEIVRRKKAVAILKGAAKKTRNPELLALVTRAENDAFKPVIAAIDKMIAILDTEQADERAKNDWCGDEIQAADMTTMKKEDHKKDLMAKIEMLDLHIKTLGKEIEEAKTEIANLESGLQRANEDRQKANLDFQKTVADQRATIEVLSKALDKLATYYDGKGDTYTVALQTWKKRAFLQTSTDAASAAPVHDWEKEFAAIGRGATSFVQVSEQRQPTAGSSSSSSSSSTSVTMTVGQTDGFSKVDTTAIAASGSYTMAPSDSGPVDLGAPVAVASFKPNKGAGGVMQFIEKLIYDAKELEKDAIASEVQAQGQYEATVTDTNDTVAELMRSIVEKKAALGEAQKDKTTTESDLFDLMKELEDLSSYSAKLHEECDYYIKNFAARQEARGVELQSLHQAKAILGGATLTQLS